MTTYIAWDEFCQSELASGSLMAVIPALAEDENAGLAVLGEDGSIREPTAEEDAAALIALRAYAAAHGLEPRETTDQAKVSAEEYLALIRGISRCRGSDSGSPWRKHD